MPLGMTVNAESAEPVKSKKRTSNTKCMVFPTQSIIRRKATTMNKPSQGREIVRQLGDSIGYGRLMQLAEEIWAEKDGRGGNHTVAGCAAFMVPCKHWIKDEMGHCDLCCGAGRVPEGVRKLVLTADDSHLAAENAELRAEIDEQCRIIGMSSEREAKLLGQIERLRKLLGEAWYYISATEIPVEQWFYDEIRAEREGGE